MYEYKFELDRVVDGDTIDVDIALGFDVMLKKQRIRLYGLNTPDLKIFWRELSPFLLRRPLTKKFEENTEESWGLFLLMK